MTNDVFRSRRSRRGSLTFRLPVCRVLHAAEKNNPGVARPGGTRAWPCPVRRPVVAPFPLVAAEPDRPATPPPVSVVLTGQPRVAVPLLREGFPSEVARPATLRRPPPPGAVGRPRVAGPLLLQEGFPLEAAPLLQEDFPWEVAALAPRQAPEPCFPLGLEPEPVPVQTRFRLEPPKPSHRPRFSMVFSRCLPLLLSCVF